MSLDLTNGDRLDVSPIVERKSNIVTLSSSIKPISTTLQTKPVQPIAVAPTLSIPSQTNIQSQTGSSVGASIPRRLNIAQSVIPRTVSPQVAAQQLAAETGTTTSGTSIPRMASPQSQSGSAPSGSAPSGSASSGSAPSGSASSGSASSGSAPSGSAPSGSSGSETTTSGSEEGSKTVGEKTEIPTLTKQDAKKGMLWIAGLVIGGIGGYFMGKKQNKVLTYSLIGAGIGGGIGFYADKYMSKKPVDSKPSGTIPPTPNNNPSDSTPAQ